MFQQFQKMLWYSDNYKNSTLLYITYITFKKQTYSKKKGHLEVK